MRLKKDFLMIKFGTGGWRVYWWRVHQRKRPLSGHKHSLTSSIMKMQRKWLRYRYDRRFLSDKAACWFAEVLAANNIKSELYRQVQIWLPSWCSKRRKWDVYLRPPLLTTQQTITAKTIEGGRDADENGHRKDRTTDFDPNQWRCRQSRFWNKHWMTKKLKSSIRWTPLLTRSLTLLISNRLNKPT